MDKAAKAKIKNLVLSLRHSLENDITLGLKRHGILADRDWLPEAQLPRLDEEVLSRRARIAAIVQASMDQGYTRQEATQEYLRRAALTFLIRLVGLKCLEVRNLIDEVITARVEYGGRSLFHRDFRHAHPELAAQPDDALPAALEAAYRLVAQEIHTLFDPDDDWSVIQPRYNALKEAIDRINGLPIEIWLEDEIVGWVYQFYRIEDRDRVRKRGQPQRVDDVAAINQFYTPRWIVRFLVDNTLGRLWLEMHPDSCLRQKCAYLVPTADLPQPYDAPVRGAKPPWEIRLLDPACGTMHFGFYASELFLEIYRETRERRWADMLPDGRSSSALTEEEMVSLIFRYNLFGITIDTWAAQLATLSLYMKLKALHPEAKVIGLNVICADAQLPEGEIREQFLDEFRDDSHMQDALQEIFKTMGDIGQFGSLFRPKEQLQRVLEKKRHPAAEWEKQQEWAAETGGMLARQRELGEITGPGAGWRVFRPLDDVLERVRKFANRCQAENNHSGLRLGLEIKDNLYLLDVLLQSYDVVVMNPPYGRTTTQAKQHLRKMYPKTYQDLYAAFLEQALKLVERTGGYTGALVSRTFMFVSSFARLRQELLLHKTNITVLAELGLGVLDNATVRPAALVFSPRAGDPEFLQTTFFRLSAIELERKLPVLQWAIGNPNEAVAQGILFNRPASAFKALPGAPFTYWASQSLLAKLTSLPPLDRDNSRGSNDKKKIADVKEGLGTRDDARFLKRFWEVNQDNVGRDKRWIPFAKGGQCSTYYNDLDVVVDWYNDGQHIKGFEKSVIRNEHFYFREGISYTRESEKATLGAYILPANCIFGDKGPSVFLAEGQDLYIALAVLNSAAIAVFAKILSPDRSRSVGLVASLPYPTMVPDTTARSLGHNTRQIYCLKAAWDTGNEICNRFSQPWLLQLYNLRLTIDDLRLAQDPNVGQQSDNQSSDELGLAKVIKLLEQADLLNRKSKIVNLKLLLDEVRDIERATDASLQELQAQIDETVYDLYDISPADRTLIERELGERPPELVWPQMEGKSDKEKRREHARRLLSYFILQALKDHPAGVLPLVTGTGEATVLDRLREGLEAAFGAEAAFRLEDDAGRVLGKSLDRWLEGEFSQWHTKLYKRRPVIWHIASPRGTFGTLVYYHKLDRDTLPKLRNVYLRTLRDGLGRELERARSEKDYKAVDRLEAALDDLTVLDERLERVIEAGYDPVIDNGVKANILPLQEAEVLRHRKVV
jgi:hypothetical protein